MSSFPGPVPHPAPLSQVRPHRGVRVSGSNGEDGRKAFYIHIEALSGKETEVVRMLEDVLGCVNDEPATGPWYAIGSARRRGLSRQMGHRRNQISRTPRFRAIMTA
jgi:hypothetical protein